MIKINCLVCHKELWRSPSKIEPRNYCSRNCYAEIRDKELTERGEPFQITKETNKILSKKRIKALKIKTKGNKHYAWKGVNVSYHGLHAWIRRELGNPTKCKKCSRISKKPHIIQWANVDGKYQRILTDYIPLCVSCHKYYDLDLAKKSTQDSPSATQ